MSKTFQRQGDIGFQPISEGEAIAVVKSAAAGDMKNRTKDRVLARGEKINEATGLMHEHKIADDAEDFMLYENEDGTLYLRTGEKPVEIVHEEHGPISIPEQTTVKVIQQREFDYTSDERTYRTVQD